MKNLKRWFTLVELIVVITILAILGSIAFISLQGYSGDARNSKRTSDLGSLEGAMATQLAEGENIMSFATAVPDNALTWSLWIGGLSVAGPGANYQAGTINYAALPVKQADFQDPAGNSYAIAVTSRNNGKHELAASMEQGAGSKVAKVMGDFNPRTTTAISGSGGSASNTFIIALNTDINKFFPNDRVSFSALWARTITKISPDGKTFTFNGASGTSGTTYTVGLAFSEPNGLIDKKDTPAIGGSGTGATIVVEAGNNLPY